MRPPACFATWGLLSPSENRRAWGSPTLGNAQHYAPTAHERHARNGGVSAGSRRSRVVPRRRTRAAKDEIALLRWLGRSARSAVALVRGGRVALTNALFREVDPRDGEWRWSFGPHAQLRYPSLRPLAC